jgi:1,4-alpha-glucan branching enzyme
MGGEFAQEREWNHDQSLDWHLLGDASHRGMQELVRDLNHAYRDTPALHVSDTEASGFEWIDGADAANSVFAFARFGNDGQPPVLVVSNFTPVVREGFRVGVPRAGRWRERLNTDAAAYGGSNVANPGGIESTDTSWHGRSASILLTLPPLATVILERVA